MRDVTTLSASARQTMQTLGVPERTIARWRHWWLEVFPATTLWQASCARFMPAVQTTNLPASLIERFTGAPADSALHLLAFLTPLTVQP